MRKLTVVNPNKSSSTSKTTDSTKKKVINFRPQIRSRHPSHEILRESLTRLPFRSIIRLGSTTELSAKAMEGRVEINTVKAVEVSSDKLLMKQAFDKAEIPTAIWFTTKDGKEFTSSKEKLTIDNLPYPIVAKLRRGSRGEGNTLLENIEEMDEFLIKHKTLSNFIFEKFYNFNKEYRVHIGNDEAFYTCRKMLKSDTPEENKWFKNDSNSVWILEENTAFDKPTNWKAVIQTCIKAVKAVGLDIGAVDVRIQNNTTEKGNPRKEINFIILETNSAPSFGDITAKKYLEILPKLLISKKNKVC